MPVVKQVRFWHVIKGAGSEPHKAQRSDNARCRRNGVAVNLPACCIRRPIFCTLQVFRQLYYNMADIFAAGAFGKERHLLLRLCGIQARKFAEMEAGT